MKFCAYKVMLVQKNLKFFFGCCHAEFVLFNLEKNWDHMCSGFFQNVVTMLDTAATLHLLKDCTKGEI